jgi:ketosteroid isomerase-like protein
VIACPRVDAETAIVLEYFRLWATQGFDERLDLLGEDFRVWVGERQEFVEGQPLREAASRMRNRFDDVSVRAGHIVSSEGCVAIELNIAGVTRDGDAVNRQYHLLMIVRDGKLRLMKEYVINAPAGSTNLWDIDADSVIDLSRAVSFIDTE